MNTLVIEKQTGGYFKFTLNGDTANAITSIQNDLLAVGTQLHFKTGNGANIIKEQFIYPADVTIIASGTFTFTTVAQVWDKLIAIDYFAWLGGGGTGGVDRFDELLDTFSYTGNAGKAVVVDGSELKLVPITLYNKRLFTELEDTPSSLVPNKMLVVNPAGTEVILQDQPEQPEQLLNSVGYFDYNDLITQTTPLNAVANVALKLTNDTEGLNTSTDQNPYGVSYVWDYTTNQFNFSELEVGDTIDVRIHVQITTTTSNQKVVLTAKFGIGSVSEFTNTIYENQFKSAGLHEINFVAPFYMGSTYITDNPAELYLTTDASATVKVDGWYVRILRKNINIITVDYTVPDATGSVKGIVRLAGDLAGTANSPTVPELANKVPNTRTVSTTSPLLGGGALSSNLTLSIQQANSVDSGYLSNVDWATFNGKANDNAVVKLTGDQSITGSKSFTTNTAAPAMVVTNNSTDNGILLQNTSTGNALRINNGALSTGDLIRAGKDGNVTFIVNQNGNTTAASFIKSGGTSSQFLKADGSVDSTAYLPLTGGTLTGTLTGTGGTFSQSFYDITLYGYNGKVNGRGVSGEAANGVGGYFANNSTTNPVTRIVGLSNTNLIEGLNTSGTTTFTVTSAGNVTANSFIKSGGTSSQYLKADGSVSTLTNPITGTGVNQEIAFFNSTGNITSSSSLKLVGSELQTSLLKVTTFGAGMVYSDSTGATGTLTGTTDTLTYWSSAGIIGSLPTIAYPSLLEISYVKGVTSSIQTQLNSKQNALTNPITGSLTTNYLPKATGSTSLGNSQIFDNGTNVGIGTTSPSALLDINGSSTVQQNLSIANDRQFTLYSDGTRMILNSVKNVPLAIYTNDTERMRISSSGNVGIGTTSPSSKLHITSDYTYSTSNPFLVVQRTGGAISSAIGLDDVNGRMYFGTTTNHKLSLRTNNTDVITLTETGNVGIGTSSPSAKLHINNGTDRNLWFRVNGNGSGTELLSINDSQNLRQSLAFSASSFYFDTGNVGIGTTSPSTALDVNGVISITAAAPYIQWKNTSNTRLGYIQHNGTNLVFNPDTGANIFNGNVGIGTTSPLMKLDIVGSSGLPATSGTTPIGSLRLHASNNAVLDFGVDNGTANGWIQSTDQAGLDNYYGLLLNPRGGNVGIGTTSPVVKLDVNGSLNIADGNNFTWGGVYGANIPTIYASKGASSYMHFAQAGSSSGPALAIINNGNVGIGTTSPVTKLHILSNNSNSTLSTLNNASLIIQNTYGSAGATGGALFFKSDTGTYNTFAGIGGDLSGSTSSGSYGHLIFGTKNAATDTSLSERMRITSGGNVGIGTTSPSYKLHNTGDTFSTNYLMNRGGGLWNIIPSSGANELYFREDTGGNIRMAILGSGNVGIGTISPTSKLQVVGLPEYATNALAISGGLTAGAFYHTSGVLKVVI